MKQKTLEIRNLSIGYIGRHQRKVVAEDINADIYNGELTCLIGSNGVGKSTLVKTLTGFQPKLEGEVLLLGKEIDTYSEKKMSHQVSVVLTDKCDIRNITVRELVGYGRSPYSGFWGKLNDADKKIVGEAMTKVKVSNFANRMVNTLSDGERQKVMIAKALAQATPIIFLDEPTAFLDYPSKVEIMQLLHTLSRQTNKTIFMTTHDLELALQIADKIWLMDKSKGINTGIPEDLSLNGSMGNFFASKGIVFDIETGLFRVENDCQKKVRLVGHGQKYSMVRKAFHRYGIMADRNTPSSIYIETGSLHGGERLILHQGNRTQSFDTIEALLIGIDYGGTLEKISQEMPDDTLNEMSELISK